ncbi:MAG: hypothetical protein KDC83_15020, partial [Flavobacteriales bacterium]|nr:hypothetical protein [Flavobacteriales bacterium]
MSRKRILVLSEWFDPAFKAGGPVRSVLGFAESLATELDIWVVTTNHELNPIEVLTKVVPDEWQKRNGYQIIYLSATNVRASMNSMLNEDWDTIYINSLFSVDFA